MTREEAKELLPIIQAFAEGKVVQYRNNSNEWLDIGKNASVGFTRDPLDYRIKPEPKYRPFESLEECWQEMLKHQPFGWLREKVNKKEMIHIGRIYDIPNNPFITLSIDEGHNYSSSYFFRTYTFADGTPFGIKLELL